jgi:DNA-binding NarL/FixJ family response regulator
MTTGPPVLPLAAAGEAVRYLLIDDEPRYRQALAIPDGPDLALAGSYGTVEAIIAIHRQPCHVVVLDLCLNRQTGDPAVLQGVLAIRQLAGLGHRVLVYTADERAEPVARCVAAGAAGYVSKYNSDVTALRRAITEIGTHGYVFSPLLTRELRDLMRRRVNPDERLSQTVEDTLVLLDRGLPDRDVAALRHVSVKTIEDHKAKILQVFGPYMKARRMGFAGLARDLGLSPGDLVNDDAGARPQHRRIGPLINNLLRRSARRTPM